MPSKKSDGLNSPLSTRGGVHPVSAFTAATGSSDRLSLRQISAEHSAKPAVTDPPLLGKTDRLFPVRRRRLARFRRIFTLR